MKITKQMLLEENERLLNQNSDLIRRFENLNIYQRNWFHDLQHMSIAPKGTPILIGVQSFNKRFFEVVIFEHAKWRNQINPDLIYDERSFVGWHALPVEK